MKRQKSMYLKISTVILNKARINGAVDLALSFREPKIWYACADFFFPFFYPLPSIMDILYFLSIIILKTKDIFCLIYII